LLTFHEARRADALDSKSESYQKSLTAYLKQMSKNRTIWNYHPHHRCENMAVKRKINMYENQFLSAEVYI